MSLLPENKWDPSQYVAEVIFFLFKIAEAMLDPSVRLYIYQSVCQVSDTKTILFGNCFGAIDIFYSKTINSQNRTHRADSNQGSDYIAIFLSLISGF